VSSKVRYIFKNNITWLMVLNYTQDMLKKVSPPRAIEALLISRLRKRLTWATGAEDIVGWNACYRNAAYISIRPDAKIPFIEVSQIFIKLTGKNALMTESLQSKMETPESGEQINKSHSSVPPSR
jgi:hypothetical protein